MEHHGHQNPPAGRVRPSPCVGLARRREEVCGAAGGAGDVRGVGTHARAHLLLPGARAAHLGDHVVLPVPRGVPDGGDRREEGAQAVPAAAEAGGVGADGGVRDGDGVLVVPAAAAPVQGGREGVRGVRGGGRVGEGRRERVGLHLERSFQRNITSQTLTCVRDQTKQTASSGLSESSSTFLYHKNSQKFRIIFCFIVMRYDVRMLRWNRSSRKFNNID